MTAATCMAWHDDDGWGVLASPDVPGELFAHFSHVVAPSGVYRSLRPGEVVEIDWEPYPPGQDGYVFRATRIERLTQG